MRVQRSAGHAPQYRRLERDLQRRAPDEDSIATLAAINTLDLEDSPAVTMIRGGGLLLQFDVPTPQLPEALRDGYVTIGLHRDGELFHVVSTDQLTFIVDHSDERQQHVSGFEIYSRTMNLAAGKYDIMILLHPPAPSEPVSAYPIGHSVVLTELPDQR